MSVRSPIIRDGMYRGTITDAHASGILRVRESKEIAGMTHMVWSVRYGKRRAYGR